MIITSTFCNTIENVPIINETFFDMLDWTKLTDLPKELDRKSFGGVTLRNVRLALNINPNSNIGGFISVLVNLSPKRRFFDSTFMCDCLLVEYSTVL